MEERNVEEQIAEGQTVEGQIVKSRASAPRQTLIKEGFSPGGRLFFRSKASVLIARR
jgi:hypothetical protein